MSFCPTLDHVLTRFYPDVAETKQRQVRESETYIYEYILLFTIVLFLAFATSSQSLPFTSLIEE